MTPIQDNIILALCFVLGVVSIGGVAWVTSEATHIVSATRVAHNETKAELADILTELASTLIELHKCENKSTKQSTNDVSI